jgi:hypothetical protein
MRKPEFRAQNREKRMKSTTLLRLLHTMNVRSGRLDIAQ